MGASRLRVLDERTVDRGPENGGAGQGAGSVSGALRAIGFHAHHKGVVVMAGRLSSDQVEFFRREGYLLFDQPVLAQARFDALKNHFEKRVVEFVETTGKSPEHFDVPHFEDVELFK